MTKKTKIILGSTAIGLAVFGTWAYSQYKKLMDYSIGFKKFKVRSVAAKKISFDVILTYVNKSDLTFYLVEQNYKVFVNDMFITRMSNAETNIIAANNEKNPSEIGVNIEVNPQDIMKTLGKTWKDILLAPEKIIIRTEMKFKVGIKILGMLVPVTVPYTYEVSLKEVLSWYK